jgi:hypothetical protein
MWCWRAVWCRLRCLARRQQASLPTHERLILSSPRNTSSGMGTALLLVCRTAAALDPCWALVISWVPVRRCFSPAGAGNKALLDSGVFRALLMLLSTGRFLHMPELRCALHDPALQWSQLLDATKQYRHVPSAVTGSADHWLPHALPMVWS